MATAGEKRIKTATDLKKEMGLGGGWQGRKIPETAPHRQGSSYPQKRGGRSLKASLEVGCHKHDQLAPGRL